MGQDGSEDLKHLENAAGRDFEGDIWDSIASCFTLEGAVKESVGMADGLYFVRVAQNEDLGRLGDSELLVQLMCEDHRRARRRDPESSALDIALSAMKSRYPSAPKIGHKEVIQYPGEVPENFRRADFPAPCGCRAWFWRGC